VEGCAGESEVERCGDDERGGGDDHKGSHGCGGGGVEGAVLGPAAYEEAGS